MVSPSGTPGSRVPPREKAHRRGVEAGLQLNWGQWMVGGRESVDLLDQQAFTVLFSARDRDQPHREGPCDAGALRFVLGQVRLHLAPTARDIGGERAIYKDHVRADGSRRPASC